MCQKKNLFGKVNVSFLINELVSNMGWFLRINIQPVMGAVDLYPHSTGQVMTTFKASVVSIAEATSLTNSWSAFENGNDSKI